MVCTHYLLKYKTSCCDRRHYIRVSWRRTVSSHPLNEGYVLSACPRGLYRSHFFQLRESKNPASLSLYSMSGDRHKAHDDIFSRSQPFRRAVDMYFNDDFSQLMKFKLTTQDNTIYIFRYNSFVARGGNGSVHEFTFHREHTHTTYRCAVKVQQIKKNIRHLVIPEKEIVRDVHARGFGKHCFVVFIGEVHTPARHDYFYAMPLLTDSFASIVGNRYSRHQLSTVCRGVLASVVRQIMELYSVNHIYKYCDLKLQNILFKYDPSSRCIQVQLCDLGSAIPLANDSQTFLTTFPPPQYAVDSGTVRCVTHQDFLDCLAWQLGVVLCQMLLPSSDCKQLRFGSALSESSVLLLRNQLVDRLSPVYVSLSQLLHSELSVRRKSFQEWFAKSCLST